MKALGLVLVAEAVDVAVLVVVLLLPVMCVAEAAMRAVLPPMAVALAADLVLMVAAAAAAAVVLAATVGLMEAVGPMAVDMVVAVTATQEVPVAHHLGGEGSTRASSAADNFFSSLLSTDFLLSTFALSKSDGCCRATSRSALSRVASTTPTQHFSRTFLFIGHSMIHDR